MTHFTLTNNLTGQVFDFYIDYINNIHFYYRVSVIMEQIAVIEDIDPANITFNLPLQEVA